MKRFNLSLLIAILLIGCATNQSATRQISDQGGGVYDIARASYLDARTWYNDAQEEFIRHLPMMDRTRIDEYNRMLDKSVRPWTAGVWRYPWGRRTPRTSPSSDGYGKKSSTRASWP